MQYGGLILHSLLNLVFYMYPYETLHVFVFAVTLVLIGVELLPEEDKPVLLDDTTLLLLLENLTLDVNRVLALTCLARLLGGDAREPARTIFLLHLLSLHSL